MRPLGTLNRAPYSSRDQLRVTAGAHAAPHAPSPTRSCCTETSERRRSSRRSNAHQQLARVVDPCEHDRPASYEHAAQGHPRPAKQIPHNKHADWPACASATHSQALQEGGDGRCRGDGTALNAYPHFTPPMELHLLAAPAPVTTRESYSRLATKLRGHGEAGPP